MSPRLQPQIARDLHFLQITEDGFEESAAPCSTLTIATPHWLSWRSTVA